MPHITEEQLSAYIDAQLADPENGLVEAHLRKCESCQDRFEEMGELNRLFRSAERLEPSPFLWTRIAADFEREHAERSSKRRWVGSVLAGMHRLGWSPGIAVASLGILMFAGIAIFKGPNIDPSALAEIDRVNARLAAEDPDAYNPFSSRTPSDFDTNPFRSVRLSGKTIGAPLKNSQH